MDTSAFLRLDSGGRGCLGEGRLGVPGQVWEFRFLRSFPLSPRENRSLHRVLQGAPPRGRQLYFTF